MFATFQPLKLTKSDKATLTPSYSLSNLDHPNQVTKQVKSVGVQDDQEANLDQQTAVNEINQSKNSISNVSNPSPTGTGGGEERTTTNAKASAAMASMSVSSSSTASTSSPILEHYLLDLKRVIEWLVSSETVLANQSAIGDDVNTVKQQFQTHEDFMLDLTKHQNNVGLVLQEGSRLINSGTITAEDDAEVRKQMKLLNDMWENLRLQAVDRQAKLHDRLMKLQTEQLNQMDAWLTAAETRIHKISQLADSIDGLVEQKDELSHLQDDLVKEQEAVDCLKQIIVVVDDNTDDQAFTDLENKLSNLSDRWSNVCKFVGNRWFTIQELIIKLQNIDADFNNLNVWIDKKAVQLDFLVRKTSTMTIRQPVSPSHNVVAASLLEDFAYDNEKFEFTSSVQLIKVLKDVELEMQAMHAKLNDMNEIGEQIGTQLNNSPQLSLSINSKMDTLEAKWNALLEKMEHLSKVCTEQQQKEILLQQQSRVADASTTASAASTSGIPASNMSNSTTTTGTNGTSSIEEDAVSANLDGKKQRVLSGDELKEHKSIEPFVGELEKLFEKVKILTAIEDMNTDEVQDLIKVTSNLGTTCCWLNRAFIEPCVLLLFIRKRKPRYWPTKRCWQRCRSWARI